jgi:hypothetical protein
MKIAIMDGYCAIFLMHNLSNFCENLMQIKFSLKVVLADFFCGHFAKK